MNELKQTGERLLESIAYGDAAGVPFETKSYRAISASHGKVDRLHPATGNVYFQGEWPAGTTSDDTQLSVAVTNALLRANGFDLRALADEHISAYHDTPQYTLKNGKVKKIGWGGATTSSVQRLIEGVPPEVSGHEGGTGNGILMKMAPLVYWQYVRCLSDNERYRQYDRLTTMTHDNDVARVSTRVHGDVLYNLLLGDTETITALGRKALNLALYHEQQIGAQNEEVSDNLHEIRANITLEQLKSYYYEKNPDMDDVEYGRNYGFYVPETLAIAYTAFTHGHQDYSETVFGAVNYGGDADSTASIAGAMVNFVRGGKQKMPDDLERVKNIDRLRRLSQQFAERALGEAA